MEKFLLAIVFLSILPSFATAQQASSCIDLKINMRQGMKNINTNNEVIALQKFLKTKGFLIANPNGSFGPATVLAVKKFQSSTGIGRLGTPGYGGVGPKSRAKIKEMTCGGTIISVATPAISGTVFAVIPTTQANISIQNQPATYQLQSAFFRNDATAQDILLGHPFDIKNAINTNGALSTNSFALKFMNGLRQVGYNGTAGLSLLSPPADSAPVVWLHKFQKINNLPQSENVSLTELVILDKLVLARESVDVQLASLLPISIAPTAPTEPSSSHVAALLATAFKAIPSSIFKWDSNNLTTFIKLQGIGVRGQGANGGAYIYTSRGACLLVYSDSLDSQCNSTYQTVNPNILEDDYSLIFHTLHEYAHYLDASLYTSDGGSTSKGVINTNGFDSISFDTSAICDTNSGWRYFNLIRLGNERNEFVTNYAIGGTITGKEGCRSSSEDFADSFAMYVTQGNVFRKLSETKPVIAQKYTWLKNNVFAGKEYFNGNADNIPAAMQLLGQYNSPALLLPFYIDYFTVNSNFVWDYKI